MAPWSDLQAHKSQRSCRTPPQMQERPPSSSSTCRGRRTPALSRRHLAGGMRATAPRLVMSGDCAEAGSGKDAEVARKLPQSCSLCVPKSYPGRSRSPGVLRRSLNAGGRVSTSCSTIAPEPRFGPISANAGQKLKKSDHCWSIWAQAWQASTTFGRVGPTFCQIWRTCPKVGPNKPRLAEFGQLLASIGQNWPNGPNRPSLDDRNSAPGTTIEQLLATIGQLRRWPTSPGAFVLGCVANTYAAFHHSCHRRPS